MRLVSRRNRFVPLLILVVGIAIGLLGKPLWRWTLIEFNQDRYGELTYLCDSAMRTHYLAKAQAANAPSAEQAINLQQSEVTLIYCQDYDILQKKMLVWGLNESDLGLMRLYAIESSADGLRDVVEAHEIRD